MRDLSLIHRILRYIQEDSVPEDKRVADVVYWDDPATREHLALLVDEYMVQSLNNPRGKHMIRTEQLTLRVPGYQLMQDMNDSALWARVVADVGIAIDRTTLKGLSDRAFWLSQRGHAN